MTAIAWKDGLLAVDSLVSMSAHQRMTEDKAAKLGGWLILGSGCNCDTDAFKRQAERMWGQSDKVVDAKTILEQVWPEVKGDTSVIFWRPGDVIVFRDGDHPERCGRAVGAFGDHDYLLGAMHAGKSAAQAVVQACTYADGCGFPVYVYGHDRTGHLCLQEVIGFHQQPSPDITKMGFVGRVQEADNAD